MENFKYLLDYLNHKYLFNDSIEDLNIIKDQFKNLRKKIINNQTEPEKLIKAIIDLFIRLRFMMKIIKQASKIFLQGSH